MQAKGGELLGEILVLGESIGNLIMPLVIQNGKEIVGDFVVEHIESETGFEVQVDEIDIIVEFVGDGGGVAVAEQEVTNPTDNHHAEEESDRENGGDTGIRVVGEKVVPFGEYITQTVRNEDGHGQEDENGGFRIEPRENHREDNEAAGDGITRGEEAFGGRKQTNDG